MTPINNRYESLDFLRGIYALSIMVYHYTGWTFGHYAACNVIGRIGVYGVSMFYYLEKKLELFLFKNTKFTK